MLGGLTPPFHWRSACIFATILAVLALSKVPLAYGDNYIDKHTLQTSIGIGAMDFDYREFNAGKRLNREHGSLFSLAASANKTWGEHFVETHVAWFTNAVDYDGQTQNGATVNTTTEQNIVNGTALYGRYLQLSRSFHHAVVTGLGYRYWQRDILSTSTAQGVLEHYTWWYGQLGWRGVYQSTARIRWLAEAKLVRPFAAEINIDFRNGFDTTALKLRAENAMQLQLTLQFKLAKRWQLNVKGYYIAWDFGRSQEGTLRRNGVAIGTVFEPASETRSTGLTISSAYTF